MRTSMSARCTSTRRRGSTKRTILTAAAILQIAGGLLDPVRTEAKPWAEEEFAPPAAAKKDALAVLKAMAKEKALLKAGEQAWVPGGYLGPSKNWG